VLSIAGYASPSDRYGEQRAKIYAFVQQYLPLLQQASTPEMRVLYLGNGTLSSAKVLVEHP
jgi:hypothetical protein